MTVRQGLMVGGTVPTDDALAFAAEVGFEFVELDAEQAFVPAKTDPEELGERLDRHGLDAVVHLPYRLDPGSPHDHVREGACRQLEAAIDFAAAVDARKGVYHAQSDAFAHVWSDAERREALYDTVERLTEYGRERGVDPCVENLKAGFFDAGDFPHLFAETETSACLDTGHAHVSGLVGAEQAGLLREYGDRISHVHLNDTRRTDDDEHLPVGLGRVAFDELVDAMIETGWSGTCTHEIYGFDLEHAGAGKRVFDRLLEEAE